ncbi:MAG: tetratricopeptide repeat protein, partial [candidate division WOR-3 bacterium]
LTTPDRPLSAVFLSANSFGRSIILFVVPFLRRVFAWDGPALARPTPFLMVTVAYCLAPLLFRRTQHRRELFLAWLWGLLFLLPFAGLFGFGPLGRLLYVSGVGFAVILALVGRSLAQLRPGFKPAFLAAALALSVAFVPATIIRSRVWQDEYTLFRRMTEEAPLNPTGHFNLAMELRRQGKTAAAEAAFRTVIALDTTCYRAYSNLAALVQARGNLDSAAALYYRTIKLRPDYALAHNNLGIVLYLKGDHAPARALLRRAIELDPHDAGAAFNLSRIYLRLGRQDSARFYVEQAFRLQPENPQIRAAREQMMSEP